MGLAVEALVSLGSEGRRRLNAARGGGLLEGTPKRGQFWTLSYPVPIPSELGGGPQELLPRHGGGQGQTRVSLSV